MEPSAETEFDLIIYKKVLDSLAAKMKASHALRPAKLVIGLLVANAELY